MSKSRMMSGEEILEDEKSADLCPCPKCGGNNYILRLNKAIDIVHVTCSVCGMKAAIFKVGKKDV